MPMIKKCVTGQKFGRLTVTADYRDMERRKNVVDVVCDCGTRKTLEKRGIRKRLLIRCCRSASTFQF